MPLTLASTRADGEEIIEGTLECDACHQCWPVRGGVPRFTVRGGSPDSERTARAFGWEWKAFPGIDDHHEQQFLDWIAPADSRTFENLVVLEGGCGKGRHTRLAAGYGARAVIGVDLSEAADIAFANTRGISGAHVIQADLLRLPLKPGCCDYAFSVGVLHHLPDPSAGFASLARTVRPGGLLSVWVYGAENNGWIARIVSPVRGALTSRISPRLLYLVSFLLSLPLYAVLATIYRTAGKPSMAWLRRFLFYYPYLSYICKFPFREVHHIVHDHLAAPVAHYLRRAQVEAWYETVGAEDTVLSWHNENSWRGFGRMPDIGRKQRQ